MTFSGVLAMGRSWARELLGGAAMSELGGWIQLLALTDLAFLGAGLWLFEPLVSD